MATHTQLGTLISVIARGLATVIERLPDIEKTIRLAKADEAKLAKDLLLLLLSLDKNSIYGEPEESTNVPHEQICIRFEIGGRRFEAVGFLKPGEESLDDSELLARIDTEGALASDEDLRFISAYCSLHFNYLSTRLRNSCLITKRRDGPGLTSVLGSRIHTVVMDPEEEHAQVCCVNCLTSGRWHACGLVLRRRA